MLCFFSICWIQPSPFLLSTARSTLSSGSMILLVSVSPTSHPTVVAVKEGAIRLSSCPVKYRKEPLEAEHLRQLLERTDLNDLLQLRNLVMFVLAFSGFLRFSELSLIRAKDIKFGNGFISVFIEKSKADQLREGQSVVIAESGSSLCVKIIRECFPSSIGF